MNQRLVLTLVAVVLVTACATSPLGRRQLKLFSEEEMDSMGVQAFAQLREQTPATSDPETNRYVTCVANAITAELEGDDARYEWEVVVFEDPSANAFALPGGKIGVHTGLLDVARNQDQLAAVIGHEVAHVLAGHGNERASQEQVKSVGMSAAEALADVESPWHGKAVAALGLGAQYGVLMPYSRGHETEADLYGLDLIARAGFDPRQSVPLWQNMAAAAGGQGPSELLSTHPAPETRIEALSARLAETVPIYQAAQAAGKRPRCG